MSKKSIILLIVSCLLVLSSFSALVSGSFTGFLGCLVIAALCIYFFIKSRKNDKYQARRDTDDSRKVYIDDNGSKYHSEMNCCGTANRRLVTIREAKKLGKTYCKKCAELYR